MFLSVYEVKNKTKQKTVWFLQYFERSHPCWKLLSFSNHILWQLEGSNILLQLKKEVLWHYEKSDCLAELCWFGGFREGCREFWWSFSGGLFHQQESLQSEQCHQQTQRWSQVCKSPVVWPVNLGPGIAQLVECLTKKPGIILVWVQALVWQRIVLSESTSSADSITVSIQPLQVCSRTPQHLGAH